MIAGHLVRVAGICAGAMALTFGASFARGEQLPRSSSGPGTQVISPAVEASWITERRGDGVDQLELLVLWRGAAGWFLRAGSSTHSGGSEGRSSLTITRGDIQLTLAYDVATRIATIQGKPLTLGTDNVVFVDDVDVPDGARVVGTMRVERPMPGSAGQIGLVMKKSREIMSFLRCDATAPEGRNRAMLDGLCLQNIGITK